jgi:acyl-CoA synthetase (NDP forming)
VERVVADVDLDTGMSRALPALRRSLQETLTIESVHAVVVALLPARGLTVEKIGAVLAECSAAAGKPVVAAFTGILDPSIYVEGMVGAPAGNAAAGGTAAGGDAATEPAATDPAPGVPCYSNPGAAVAALAAVVRYAQWVVRDQGLFVEPDGCDPEAAHEDLEELLRPVGGEQLVRLEPAAAAKLLGRYGIRVLPSEGFEDEDQAVAAADRLGWPVALKTTDPALRHRLDLGGVRLDIQDADSLRRNIVQMRRSLQRYGSPSLEVQSMAPVGQACTFRAIEDPLLGPVVSFGLAGDAVNLLDDWAHRVPPLSGSDVHDFIRAPRASRKLFGYQGLPAVDVAALEDLAARLTRLKDNHPEIAPPDPTAPSSSPPTSGLPTRPSGPTRHDAPCAAEPPRTPARLATP